MVYRSCLEFFCLRKWTSSNILLNSHLLIVSIIVGVEKNDNERFEK